MTQILISYLVGILCAGAAWQYQGQKITKLELENATRIATEQREYFRRLEKDTTTVVVAQNNKVVRDAVIRTDSAAAIAAGNGLRIASAESLRAAQADASACIASVAQYDELLNAVVAAGGAMAVEADQWASDAMMLHDAFPK